ncbi:hypothetical protein PV797_00430 [Clostridiaceae bacterium M8S5]|nr:hypothetical protein PV797_00430 [Clostridiaceae bacterium M8S5]
MSVLNNIAKANIMPDGMLSTVSGTEEAFINIIKDKPNPTSTKFLSDKGEHKKK